MKRSRIIIDITQKDGIYTNIKLIDDTDEIEVFDETINMEHDDAKYELLDAIRGFIEISK